MTLANPRSWPSAPCSAVITTSAQNREPSLRTRHPSFSHRPFAIGLPQTELREPRALILLRVELREVPSDDLVGPIALEALDAEVPARHSPVRVEQEDGVVADPADEQAEPLLALP